MAEKLIDGMTGDWNPSAFKDTYSRELLARVKEKIKARETHKLTPAERTREPRQSAQVIDLMDVLRKSLEQGKGAKRAGPAAATRRRRTTRPRKRKAA